MAVSLDDATAPPIVSAQLRPQNVHLKPLKRFAKTTNSDTFDQTVRNVALATASIVFLATFVAQKSNSVRLKSAQITTSSARRLKQLSYQR